MLNVIGQSNCRIIMYADDTNIFIACGTIYDVTTLANFYLGKVESYMASNLLHINLDKSCFMYFPPGRKFLNTKTIEIREKKAKSKNNDSPKTEAVIEKTGIIISIGKTALKEVTETKFLGIIFDPLLNWNAHIKHLKSKLKTSFAIIKRISPYVTSNNHKQIYHTLFESHLTYCIPIWGGAKKKLIDQIFTLQKLAVRYLFGDNEKFFEKFNTAARTRPLDEQRLGHDYFCKEHKKPLFNEKKLCIIYTNTWQLMKSERS